MGKLEELAEEARLRADLAGENDAGGHLPPGLSDDALVAHLARLPALAYEHARKSAAQRLGCRATTLDQLVARARPADPTPTGQGTSLHLPEPEPWPDPVDGAGLLDLIARTVRRHVVLPEEACTAVSLWVAFSYCLDIVEHAPRLLITSPERRCGKSILGDILTELVLKPLPATNITPAALFRTIEAARPTVLLDEADIFLPENEELRGLVNSGHRRGAAFVICTVGEEHEPRRFSTWCALAIIGIGRQHATITDRSIVLGLQRRLPGEPIERLDPAARRRLQELARKLARWTADHGEEIGAASPDVPRELGDRAADNWRPLLAIADAAGGSWALKGRAAASKLSGEAEDDSLTGMLLADLRSIFTHAGDPEALPSSRLVTELGAMEHRPWPELSRGKPITARKLAALVARHGVAPFHTATGNGYRRRALAELWRRYLPAETEVREASIFQRSSNGAGFEPITILQPGPRSEGSLGTGKPRPASIPEGMKVPAPAIEEEEDFAL